MSVTNHILYKLAQLVTFVLALILGKLKCIRVHEGLMLTKRFFTVSAHGRLKSEFFRNAQS